MVWFNAKMDMWESGVSEVWYLVVVVRDASERVSDSNQRWIHIYIGSARPTNLGRPAARS